MTLDLHDHDEKLAHMAEQIAAFFASYPAETAPASIAEHINQFWSKKMRQDFCTHYDADPSALTPLVAKALPLIKRSKA
ncbi:MAG: formate dehydrogenase subunit delta [Elsteraceae bacterium]